MWTRRSFFVFSCLVCVIALPHTAGAQSLYHGWSDRFGDANGQYASDVATDGSGNVIVVGEFTGSVDFGGGLLTSAGSRDMYVAKFDAAGNHLWSNRFGDVDIQYGRDVAVDGLGNVIVAGRFGGTVDFGGGPFTSAGNLDIYVAKFDAAGNHLWSRSFGDANEDGGYCCAVDASGNVFLVGYFYGTVDLGGGVLTSAGSGDIFVAKFDTGGNHLWSQRFGDADGQYPFSVSTDGSGNVIITGYFSGTVDFGGGPLTSAGNRDIFVAKLNTAGAHRWSDGFGDAGEQFGVDVAVDGSKNVILTGDFYGTVDFGGGPLTSTGSRDIYVAEFDAVGNHLWSRRFGDMNAQYGLSVSTDGSDNVILTGHFDGTVDFGGGGLTSAGNEDIYLARFDAAGNHLWSQRFGDASIQFSFGVATDGPGNAIVVGDFMGSVDFGGGVLTAAGANRDIFVAKFWQAEPRIAGIRDIPGDQGGWVNLAWDASGADTPAEHAITHYTYWRAIQPSQVTTLLASGATLVTDPSGGEAGSMRDPDKPLIRMERIGAAAYYWYLMGSVDAYYLEGYSAPVATLFDSTAVSNEYHYFQVIAHTSDPYTFYVSPPDSGYSVDNLSPAAPLALVGLQSVSPNGLTLSWRANQEPDLASYAIYRGLSEDFVPDPFNRIASPEDTTDFDGGWTWNSGYYYKVSAFDIHGNESGCAVLVPEDVTGVGGSGAPPAFYLGQNYPNPFHRSTWITFGLGEPAEVSLKIYDVSGRLVRVLVKGSRDARTHEVEWDGLDARGRRVASGVYFYHLTAGSRTHIRKAVLLR